jgi:hypothetical protein
MLYFESFINTHAHFYSETDNLPAFVVPAYVQFTPNQLVQLIQAGQAPGVPFQISQTAALRAVGDRKKASLVDSTISIRRKSIYLEKMPRGKLSLGFIYDALVPIQLNLYVTAKDKSDTAKLK